MTTTSFGNAFTGEKFQPFTLPGTTGRAWLLIHGFPGTPAEMQPVADCLHTLGDTVHAVLLPGFGAQIDTINAYTVDDWLAHCAAELQELRLTHHWVGVVGLSMGGALATKLSTQMATDALILLAPFWKLSHVLWKALPVVRYVIPQFKPFRLFKPDWADPRFRESVANFMPTANLDDEETRKAIMDFNVPVQLFDQIRRAGVLGAGAAPNVTCPTQIIQGLDDELVLPATTRSFMGLFNNKPHYIELPGPHTLTDSTLPTWPAIARQLTAFALNITETAND